MKRIEFQLHPRVRFSSPWALVALVVVLLPLMLSAGIWQAGRAELKDREARERLLADQSAPAGCEALGLPYTAGRRVELHGRYDPDHAVLLDNRTANGRAGYELLVPLDCAERVVMVNLGWLPTPAKGRRDVVPRWSVPADAVTINGVASRRAFGHAGVEDPFPGGTPLRIGRVDPGRIAEYAGRPIADWIVLATRGSPGALETVTDQPTMTADRHRGYAFQWFAMSAGLALWFITASFRSRP